jgi:endo-1,3-1,4-beta-glycanase ExoK
MPPRRRFPLLLGLLLLLLTIPSGVASAASRGFADDFTAFDGGLWAAGNHVLGRSTLDPANVAVSGGRLELALPAGTTDGADVRTQSTYRYGSYRARIQVADAPSSITGFFLYAPPDYESEIDVELFNEPQGEVMSPPTPAARRRTPSGGRSASTRRPRCTSTASTTPPAR